MKKLFIFIVMAALCHAVQAKTAEETINEIKAETGAMVVTFDKEMLKKQLGNDGDIPNEVLESVDNGTVLILEEMTDKKKDVFESKVDGLTSADGYEQLVSVFDDSDKVKILGRKDGDVIKELLIIVSDNEDCLIVLLNGNIKVEDLGKLVNDKTINVG